MGNVAGTAGRVPPQRVLFVCRANVCRSPLMAAAFAQAVGDDGVPWRIESRGTDVVRSTVVCEIAADLAGDPATAGAKSRALNSRHIDNADLVVVSSLRERAMVTQLVPSARGRVFTLREALHLAKESGTDGRGQRQSGHSSVRAFAEHLDARRGLVPIPEPRSYRFLRLRTEHPYDVPDVHGASQRRHRRVLEETREAAHALGNEAAAFVAGAATQ
ncbi:hypothetical protein ACFQZV_03500 [Microbacterium koreense]|uniref:Phosphotyrosine protein phosphatase I domain-containing protein n=1 Tax=Microbacterium koreense TaxID=323761 RepID=A0ABW2ZP19_9MICO